MMVDLERLLLAPAGDDLVAIDSFVQHNATACAYLAFQNDSPSSQQHPQSRSPVSLQSPPPLLTLQQLLNVPTGKTCVPAVYKTCLAECILGTTDLETVLIGLSDLYEQVSSASAPVFELHHICKTCLAECILGTTDLERLLIGLSYLYELLPSTRHVWQSAYWA